MSLYILIFTDTKYVKEMFHQNKFTFQIYIYLSVSKIFVSGIIQFCFHLGIHYNEFDILFQIKFENI